MTLAQESKRFAIGTSIVLFILALVARLPFLSSHLFDWDLVQLALGVSEFNLAKHQPHPPGYILFVGMARLLNGLLRDVNLSFTLLSALSSAASTSLIFVLSLRLFVDRRSAILAALLWLTSPLVWFYGEVGETYAVGVCAGLAVAFATWRFWQRPTEVAAIASGALYAFAAGVRQDLTAFLSLLWLAPYLYSRPCRRFFLTSSLTFAAAYLSWYVPTVLLSGGYAAYSKLMRGQFLGAASSASIFLGGSPVQHAWILFKQASALFDGLLGFWVLIPLLLVLKKGASLKGLMAGDEWRFLLAWASPALLFFTLLYFAKLGYFLVCLPPIVLLASRWAAVSTFGKGGTRLFCTALLAVTLTNVGFFFGARQLAEYPFADQGHSRVRLVVRALNDSVLTPTEHKVAVTEEIRKAYFQSISSALSGKPAVVLIVASWGRDELSWRTLMYYYPDVPVYGIMSDFMSAAGPPPPLLIGFERTTLPPTTSRSGETANVSLLGRSRLLLVSDAQLGQPTLVESSSSDIIFQEITPPLADPTMRTFRLYTVAPGDTRHLLFQVGGCLVRVID